MPTWNGTADTDARLREQAEKALRQEILLHGYLHLNKVTPVLREAGVDTAVYGGKGPKLWLKNEFRGTFSVVENPDRPGSEIVLMSGSLLTPGENVARLSPRETAEGIARIRDLIAEKGQIRFSEIPRLLKENGIGDYRAYTSGIKLKVWLLMTFKEFRASEDGFTLLVGKAGARAAAPERETAASGEDRQLFRFCYFRSWSQNARNRRSGLTDELLDSLSDDCRFYIKSAVVVEDRLSSLKFTDADFTPQMILYGKAMEQCLKDELYDLFHAEPVLSSFNVRGFTGAMETFGNRGRDRIQISGFAALIKAQASHLASLCSGASDGELRRCSAQWWTNLSDDVLTANSVRNKVHPGKGNAVETDVNRLVDALIGSEDKEGILSRLEVGRQLYRLMYTNPIPLNARQTYCNTQQELRVVQVKPGQKLRIRAVLRAPGNREYTVKLRLDKETGKGLVPGSRLQAALGEALSQDGEEFFHGEVVSILS